MSSTFIFEGGKSFPHKQCHASTLAMMPDGTFVAAWFAGTREADPDTAIWSAHMKNGVWQEPKKIAKVDEVAHWNPVLFLDPDGILRLFFKVGTDTEAWKTWTSKMDPKTETWSDPEPLIGDNWEGGRGPVRGKIIVLPNGRWLAPASTEKVVGWTLVQNYGSFFRRAEMVWDSFIDVSDDNGKTWTKSPIPFDRNNFGETGGIIQPSLWNSSESNVHVFLRSSHGKLFRSNSDDGGKTWSPAEPTSFPNPNSAVDVAQRSDGTLLMVFNPIAGNWVRRSPLSVALSKNDGAFWSNPVHIEDGLGSYSYPFAIPTDSGFAMTYTWNRTRIAFIEMKLDPILQDLSVA